MNLGSLFVTEVSYTAALSAGLLAFFTPCVLPLIPAWLAMVTGLSFEELADSDKKQFGFLKLLVPTVFFILGFTLIFSLMGAAAGWAGEALKNHASTLRYVSGAFLIFFGLYLAGFIKPAFMMREKRAEIHRRPLGLIGAFVVGMGFAAGWTPCVGPVLGSILALAASEQSAADGFKLLVLFSLGLGLPFIAVSLAWGKTMSFLARIRPLVRYSGQALGALMMVLGVAVIAGKLSI